MRKFNLGQADLRRVSAVALVAVLLAGCAAPSIGVEEMRVRMSERLAEGPSHERSAPSPTSEGFELALRRAVLENEGYLATLAVERQLMSRIRIPESGRYPQLAISLSAGASAEPDALSDAETGVTGGISFTQMLFDGGATAAGVNRATAEALRAQADRVVTENEVAYEAARAWVDLWVSNARLALLRDRLSRVNELLDRMSQMSDGGLINQTDLDAARREAVSLSLEEAAILSDREDARVRFTRYFGRDEVNVPAPTRLFSDTEVRAMSDGLDGSPVMERAVGDLFVSQGVVEQAEADLRPSALLRGALSSPVTIGVSLDYPFLDGGRRRAALDAARAGLDAAESGLLETRTDLTARVRAALVRMSAIDRASPLIEEKVRLSRSGSEMAASQIAAGQASVRDLVDSEIDLYRAEDQRLSQRAERALAKISVAAMAGRLAPRLGVTPPEPADVAPVTTEDAVATEEVR